MLYLIGIGNKTQDINLQTLEVIKNCENIFIESYTSFYGNSLKELEQTLKKKIKIAYRETIEIEIDDILKHNKQNKQNTALLVIGDPLSATTHTDLIQRCKELNINYKIINNVSIFNLIGRTGLQIYKFGKTTSIPFFNEKFKPQTPHNILKENLSIQAHSLLLLDINPKENKYLEIKDAINYLEELDKKDKILKNKKIIICSQLATPKEKIIYTNLETAKKLDENNKFKAPVCLIIPGNLHFSEEEFLKQYENEK